MAQTASPSFSIIIFLPVVAVVVIPSQIPQPKTKSSPSIPFPFFSTSKISPFSLFVAFLLLLCPPSSSSCRNPNPSNSAPLPASSDLFLRRRCCTGRRHFFLFNSKVLYFLFLGAFLSLETGVLLLLDAKFQVFDMGGNAVSVQRHGNFASVGILTVCMYYANFQFL